MPSLVAATLGIVVFTTETHHASVRDVHPLCIPFASEATFSPIKISPSLFCLTKDATHQAA